MTSIIIVTYNSGKFIEKCLHSLRAFIGLHEIIVVDNASTDTTPTILENLKKEFGKSLHLVFSQINTGFTGGCNLGAKHAKGTNLFFLNPDTELVSKVGHFNDLLMNEQSSIIGFKFLNPDKTLQPSAGMFPTLFRIIADRLPVLSRSCGIIVRKENFYTKLRKCDWVSGSGFLISKNNFDRIGGLDEEMYMYGEDIDLCYRTRQKGIETEYDPSLTFIHADTGTNDPGRKPDKYLRMRRGLLYFLQRYRSAGEVCLFIILVRIEASIRRVYLRLTGTRHLYLLWDDILRRAGHIEAN